MLVFCFHLKLIVILLNSSKLNSSSRFFFTFLFKKRKILLYPFLRILSSISCLFTSLFSSTRLPPTATYSTSTHITHTHYLRFSFVFFLSLACLRKKDSLFSTHSHSFLIVCVLIKKLCYFLCVWREWKENAAFIAIIKIYFEWGVLFYDIIWCRWCTLYFPMKNKSINAFKMGTKKQTKHFRMK